MLGHVWRYRYDKFGWTTRSSQMYERRLLRWGSPLFHFGILAVFLGHVMGLGVPKSWTEAVGISEGVYHFLAVSVGAVAGVLHRRRPGDPDLPPPHRRAGVQRDHAHGQDDVRRSSSAVILLGLWNTVASNIFGHYDYRDGVSVWFRGIFRFDLHPELMAEAPLGFQLHGMLAMLLFALWPFTRLVHVFSAPDRLPVAAVRGLPQPRAADRLARAAARMGAGGQRRPALINAKATPLLPAQRRRHRRTDHRDPVLH